jgi:diguanylate cyclase (GGDEF)-like protein/PAS domain S-box-containing protein
LHTEIECKPKRFFKRQLRQFGFVLRLAGCFLSVVLATVFVGLAPEANFIWVANGVLLAYLLLAPRKRWPAYICAAVAAQFAGGLFAGHHGIVSGLYLTLLNVAESLVSALLLRHRSSDLPDFTAPAYVTRFLAFGVFAGPIATGAIDTLLSPLWHIQSPLWHAPPPGVEFLQWVAADALGACVATPACVAIFRARFRDSLFSFKHWAHLLPVVVVAYMIFSRSTMPLAFILFPLLILVLLRLDLGWAALAALFVAAIASWYTVHHLGPFASFMAHSPIEPAVFLQIYIASAVFTLYSVSVVLENLRATDRRLQETAALHKLVMENSRDVIIIADFDGRRSFVSAAGADWGSWTRAELQQLHSLDLVHPEDLPKAAAALQDLRTGKSGAEVECRVRTRAGNYIWVEARLRTIRDPVTNLPTGVLNNVREITERKRAEQKLEDAYHTVETMAITDALTGLANRRRFDQCIASEWRRAMRERRPLSLLLIDADHFKSYNDSYGHLHGDSCLKQIAEAAQQVVARSGDFVARFGGEEFAVILPNTGSNGALRVAEDICASIRNRRLSHGANPSGIVTVSAGSATLIPQLGDDAALLIDYADKALYQAKHEGRDCARKYRPDDDTKIAANERASVPAIKSA